MGLSAALAFRIRAGASRSTAVRCVVTLAAFCALFTTAAAQNARTGPSVEVFSANGSASEGSSDGIGGSGLWRLPVDISVNLTGGYDDNPGTVEGGEDSAYASGSLSIAYQFGTERTRAWLNASTGMTYYPDISTNRYDPNVQFSLGVSHPVSLRMNLNAYTSFSYRSEPDFSTDLSTDRRADHLYTSNSISMSYQMLPRITLSSSYSFGMVVYEENVFDSQDRVEQSFGQTISFLYLPVTSLVADYRFGWVMYTGDGDDSFTHSFLLGANHTFSERLSGSIRGGVGYRTVDRERMFAENAAEGLNPHFEANLSYVLTGKATLAWNASYATEESYIAGSAGSLSLRTGLIVSYTFTDKLSSSLSCFYNRRDDRVEFFSGTPVAFTFSFIEESFDINLGVNYSINSFLSANAGFSHTQVDSELALRTYSRSRYYGGLNISF